MDRAPAATTVLLAAGIGRIPEPLGQFRAANLAYRAFVRHSGGRTRATLKGGATFTLDVGEWPQAQAFLRKTYDPGTVDFVVGHLPQDGTFLDVGAHIGLVTFQVLRRLPTTTVHAFEPRAATAADFRVNAELNPGKVTLNECGLSDHDGELPFDPDTHSIQPVGAVGVPVTTLDGYLDTHGIDVVDVMKIDVEGHEASVLKGGIRALSDHRVRVITMERMEEHGDTLEAAEVLRRCGYREIDLGPHSAGNAAYTAE